MFLIIGPFSLDKRIHRSDGGVTSLCSLVTSDTRLRKTTHMTAQRNGLVYSGFAVLHFFEAFLQCPFL